MALKRTSQPYSSSYAGRTNLMWRIESRRFTRRTNTFSMKVENHAYSIATHMVQCRLIRISQIVRYAMATAAGATDKPWKFADMVQVVKEREVRGKEGFNH